MLTLHRKVSLVAVVIALVTLFFFTNRLTAQNLVATSLRSDDFEEVVTVFADEAISAQDISHPLGSGEFAQAIADKNNTVYKYDVGYNYGAMVPTTGNAVGHFQYQYSTEQTATEIASLVYERLSSAPSATILQENVSNSDGSANGHTIKMIGDEGDFVYWFVGNHGNILSLVLVNGLDETQVSKTFEFILPIALNK